MPYLCGLWRFANAYINIIYRKEFAMTKDEHRSTVRVLSILLALSNTPDGMTLAELSQQLSAPKSSLFTIIHTMANQNFASYNEVTQKYSIGLNAYLTGVAYMETHNIFERFQEEMKSIVNQCSEICQLGILDHSEVLYLAKVDSPEPIRLSSSIGKRLPAYCTSLGKSLLCECTKEDLEVLFPNPLIPFTPNTVKNLDELYKQILTVRATSIAIERGETHPDISCISTPLFHNGKPAASISVSVPTFRFTPEKQTQIEQILLSAKPRFEKLLEQNERIL